MIIAVDFDGVLCKNRFPQIGEPDYDMISKIRQLSDLGHEMVLWTSRTGQELDDAVDWCGDRGLHFCAVNENAPSNRRKYMMKYPNGTRKAYADLYIDDHNIEYVRSRALSKLDDIIGHGVVKTSTNSNYTEDEEEGIYE